MTLRIWICQTGPGAVLSAYGSAHSGRGIAGGGSFAAERAEDTAEGVFRRAGCRRAETSKGRGSADQRQPSEPPIEQPSRATA